MFQKTVGKIITALITIASVKQIEYHQLTRPFDNNEKIPYLDERTGYFDTLTRR